MYINIYIYTFKRYWRNAFITSPSAGLQSIVISVHVPVFLSCLFVCLSVRSHISTSGSAIAKGPHAALNLYTIFADKLLTAGVSHPTSSLPAPVDIST